MCGIGLHTLFRRHGFDVAHARNQAQTIKPTTICPVNQLNWIYWLSSSGRVSVCCVRACDMKFNWKSINERVCMRSIAIWAHSSPIDAHTRHTPNPPIFQLDFGSMAYGNKRKEYNATRWQTADGCVNDDNDSDALNGRRIRQRHCDSGCYQKSKETHTQCHSTIKFIIYRLLPFTRQIPVSLFILQ